MNLQARIASKQIPQVRREIDSLPSPVLGWNARDAEDNMDPRFALQMINYFPDGSNVKLRQGTQDHATGFAGPVEYLHTYRQGETEKLFAFADLGVYDVSGSGPIGAPLATGFSNNRWFGVNAGVNGGETGIYANGSDPMQQYAGTTWGASGITGVAKGTGLTVSKKRVWGIENGTGEAWYLDTEAVSGAASKFDVGSIVPSGGELLAIGNITVDGSSGPDDLTVFVMQTGAVILYAGTDPSDAANWSLRGVWNAPLPIGGRCLVPFDQDLILITNAGFISLLGFTASGDRTPVSDAINPAVSNAAKLYLENYGWNGIYYPRERQVLFNIPTVENQQSEQYVMNSLYKPWCKFQGWNVISSAIRLGTLYMGTDQKVLVSSDAKNDSGNAINGFVQTAWNYFRSRGLEKHFKQYRPNIRTDATIELGLSIGVEFQTPAAAPPQSVAPSQGAVWDVSEWDVGEWARGLETFSEWRGAGNKGYNASVAFTTRTTNAQVELLATDILYEPGGIL